MSRAIILVEIGYTQTHHINVVHVPYKTVLMLKHIYICNCTYFIMSSRIGGWAILRTFWVGSFASLLEIVNGHEIQIKYVVAKYPKGTSQNPS